MLLALVTGFGLMWLASCGQPSAPSGAADTARDAQAYMHSSRLDSLIARFENPERAEWQKPKDVLQVLGRLDNQIVADIGAGSGYFTFPLAAKAQEVIAIDVDSGFIQHLAERIQAEEIENVELRLSAPDSPNLDSAEVDLVFLSNVYHHIEDRPAYFRHVKRALKEEGRLFIVDFRMGDFPVGPPTRFKVPLETVQAELQAAGFSQFEADTVSLPYQYMLAVQ